MCSGLAGTVSFIYIFEREKHGFVVPLIYAFID